MNNQDPLFKSVFGAIWDKMPPVFHKRYANRPHSHDITIVEGEMDIYFSKVMLVLIPLFRIFHVLVPFRGEAIPVKVEFLSQIDAATVRLVRKFYFPGRQPYEFNSQMHILGNNDVIEFMQSGLGWRTDYYFDGIKVVMRHKRYVLKVLGLNIPLPLELILGKGHAEEEMIDDNSYRIAMTISHPWFGTMYGYSGIFTFTRLTQ